MSTERPDWQTTLDELVGGGGQGLAAGAELEARGPEGEVQGCWPLARHWRLAEPDEDGSPTVWVRPLVGGGRTPTGTPVFSLQACRRRGISFQDVRVLDAHRAVVFTLGSGQTVSVRPATGERLERLTLWDAFVSHRLPAIVELELGQLLDDSWHGKFA